jgi:hypothetical protein
MTTPAQFIARMKSEGRVCPQPLRWNDLWELLPDRKRVGTGWEPPLPLILAAWHHTSDEEKRLRLHQHLQWAEQHDALDQAISFLKSLPATDWHLSTDH